MASKASKDAGSQPNREELLQMGIRAAKAGNRDAARLAFEQVLTQDKRNERAMMWMAKLAENKIERKKWLERVISVNPDNDAARTALQKIAYRRSARENRVLIIFGVIVGLLVVVAIAIGILLALTRPV